MQTKPLDILRVFSRKMVQPPRRFGFISAHRSCASTANPAEAAMEPEQKSLSEDVEIRRNPELVQPSRPTIPSVHDPPRIVRPGQTAHIGTVVRNYWSTPAVGFNTILECPVQPFAAKCFGTAEGNSEAAENEEAPVVVLPNDIFAMPIRKDILHKVYHWHRKAMAGYDETMQLYKWEWPGSNKKMRGQRMPKKLGMSRMSRRVSHGWYEGVFAKPVRPKDWRERMQRRVIWHALKVMLSAKFAQNQIKVVDSFNIASHKTKHLVKLLRDLLGDRCNSALLIHEGTKDVNNNFRWASAHIASIRRESVEGVSVYNLFKYHEIVITETALHKLINDLHEYPKKRGWTIKYATPDNTKAPVPEKVPGWNQSWIDRKERLRNAEFRSRALWKEQKEWKWNYDQLKGPLKVPRTDPLDGFRVKDFGKPGFTLYRDDDPIDLEEENTMDEITELLADRRDHTFRGPAGSVLSGADIAANNFRSMEKE